MMKPRAAAAIGVLAAALWYLPSGSSSATAASTVVHDIAGGPFEASGVVHVRDTAGVLFVDDGRTREVFWMPIGADRKQGTPVQRVALDADVTDLEGITSDGSLIYVVGSQSKKKGVEGDGLVRFRFDASSRTATQVERIRGLKAWLAARVPELKGVERRKGDEALNIEAIAWDEAGQRLLLGLRAPVVEGKALVIPLAIRDKAAPFTTENLSVAGPTLRVNLGGAGIRSLEYDEDAKAFTLIAASGVNKEKLDFRVLEWDGRSAEPGRQLVSYPSAMKPEGITRASLGGQKVSVVVFDTSRFTVLD